MPREFRGLESQMHQATDYSRDDARGRGADALEAAHLSLRNELIDALMTDPQRTVWTPAWKSRKFTALGVVEDNFAGSRSQLLEILKLIKACTEHPDHLIRLSAQSIVANLGDDHAQTHADDAAEEA